MPDVDARLDGVEQGLKTLGERMDERFAKVDERFVKVDERFGSLEAEVQKLRVLEESNAAQIKQIAEVQVHHGNVLAEHGAALQRIEKAIEPLQVLPEAFRRVFGDHERRISALEEAGRQRMTGG